MNTKVDTRKNEVWKHSEEYPDIWISSEGRILSRVRIPEILVTIHETSDGYLSVSITDKNGKRRTWLVHRLVAFYFLGTSELDVNHKDKNKKNNSLLNLEYCTKSYNVSHAHQGRKRFVSFHKGSGKFNVVIHKMVPRNRGSFNTREEAYQFAHKEYLNHFGFEPWSK